MTREKYRGLNVFFLPSYVGLLYVLYRFSIVDEKILFLTSNKSLLKLLNRSGAKAIEVPTIRNDYSRKALTEIHKLNMEMASEFQDCNIIHFYYRNDIAGLSLIKLLKKQNLSTYIPLDPPAKQVRLFQLKPTQNIKKFGISQLAYRFIFGFTPAIFECDDSYFLGHKMATAINEIGHLNESIFSDNKKRFLQGAQIGEIDILYIDNASVHYPKAAMEIALLLKNLELKGYKITIKPHPTFKPLDIFNSFNQISDEIPAELCMNFANVVLGFSTTALKHTTDNLVISFLKMVEVDEAVLNRNLVHLKSPNIHFPVSEKELFQLIKKV